ncbi:hypothetical protein ARMGADRAFT_184475 [Armillaria gallica]|uniref:Uncharacterized protein n=1 Tax=Armillaria gallica TaxID=47427 RepID=A0A2H3DXW9_ARMGA|nr:hypothetical protein ARMGADRAFT_184475 [Armillaria gallica]
MNGCITSRTCVAMPAQQTFLRYLFGVILPDTPQYLLHPRSTCLPQVCTVAVPVCRSITVTHISTADIMESCCVSVVSRFGHICNCTFYSRNDIRYPHGCRISYSPSLCVYTSRSHPIIFLCALERALRLSLIGHFEDDATRLDEGLQLVDPQRRINRAICYGHASRR